MSLQRKVVLPFWVFSSFKLDYIRGVEAANVKDSTLRPGKLLPVQADQADLDGRCFLCPSQAPLLHPLKHWEAEGLCHHVVACQGGALELLCLSDALPSYKGGSYAGSRWIFGLVPVVPV